MLDIHLKSSNLDTALVTNRWNDMTKRFFDQIDNGLRGLLRVGVIVH